VHYVAGPSLWNSLPSDMKLSTLTAAPFCSQPAEDSDVSPQFLRTSAVVVISIITLA